MLIILLFVLIAMIPSVIGALSGIGGGIIIKPVLDLVAGISGNIELGAKKINFLSGCTVLSMSAVFLLKSRIAGIRLEKGKGIALAFGAVLGGLSGKAVFSLVTAAINNSLVGAVQSIILVILTGFVILYIVNKESVKSLNLKFLPLCAVIGLGLGLISAFLGIGGGPVNIMAISFFLSMDTKTTAHHSLFIVFLSQLASLTLTLITGVPQVLPVLLAAMISGGIAGSLIGSRIYKLMNNKQADKLFCIVMAGVIFLSVFNFIGFIRKFMEAV